MRIIVHNCHAQYNSEQLWICSLLTSRQSSQLWCCLLEGRGSCMHVKRTWLTGLSRCWAAEAVQTRRREVRGTEAGTFQRRDIVWPTCHRVPGSAAGSERAQGSRTNLHHLRGAEGFALLLRWSSYLPDASCFLIFRCHLRFCHLLPSLCTPTAVARVGFIDNLYSPYNGSKGTIKNKKNKWKEKGKNLTEP